MTGQSFVDLQKIEAYRADGAVLIKSLLHDWVDILRDGIEKNMAFPGRFLS